MSDQKIDMFKGILPGEPLYKLAPTRDENGRSFVDFMLIIPKLKKKPKAYIEQTSERHPDGIKLIPAGSGICEYGYEAKLPVDIA